MWSSQYKFFVSRRCLVMVVQDMSDVVVPIRTFAVTLICVAVVLLGNIVPVAAIAAAVRAVTAVLAGEVLHISCNE